MSDKIAAIERQVQEQGYEINTLKDSLSGLVNSLQANTEAMTKLSQNFAVYASKHDANSEDIKTLQEKSTQHGEDIAAMKPVVDATRGLVWKIVTASFSGMIAVAGVVVAIMKTL